MELCIPHGNDNDERPRGFSEAGSDLHFFYRHLSAVVRVLSAVHVLLSVWCARSVSVSSISSSAVHIYVCTLIIMCVL